MNCPDVQHLLEPYADGELDLVRRVEIERHLSDCGRCAEQDERLRSLRAVLASPSLYHRAPAGLRGRLQLATPSATRRRTFAFGPPTALAASILLFVGTFATLGVFWSASRASADERLADLVVAGHVRSLQVEHLTDVASSDRHTVKPWFRGKLDFSPEVLDLSAQGYPLTGGRLEYLADRPVAALVYHRRAHAINLFTWPADGDESKPVRKLARQGFHIRHWQRSGMNYWAISDLADPELDEFVGLLERSAP